MSSNVATIAKNLILFKEVASGTISFSTGATAGATVTVDITTPRFPIGEYIFSVKSNATQTTLNLSVNNMRQMQGTTAIMLVTSMTYNTGVSKDVIVEGAFGGAASNIRLIFGIGTAATASEQISANYQIWEHK
jgi:hypothetical protein